MSRRFKVVICTLLGLSLFLPVIACTPTAAEPVTITILYNGSPSEFQRDYGDEFAKEFPHISVNVVSMQDLPSYLNLTVDQLLEAAKSHNADIVQIFDRMLLDAVRMGKLTNLEPYIQKSDYDIAKLYPPVVDWLRQNGEGEIFGLSAWFDPSALFYNRSLFDKHGVPYPQPGISWPEVLELAARFPSTDEFVGLSLRGTLSQFLFATVGNSERIAFYDQQGTNLTVETETWKRYWSMIIDAYIDGHLITASSDAVLKKTVAEEELLRKNGGAFAAGKAAMTLGDVSLMETLDRMSEYNPPIVPPFEWDLVPEPNARAYPGVLDYLVADRIYSIPTDSAYKDAAWELVKFMNEEATVNRIGAISGTGVLPAIREAVSVYPDKNMDAFYAFRKLEPLPTLRFPYFTFYELADKEIEAVRGGVKTAEEALHDLQLSGQAALEEWKAAESSEK